MPSLVQNKIVLIALLAGAFFVSKLQAKDWLDDEQFILGKSFFEKPWVAFPASTTARDGLGPLFNQNACANCHSKTQGQVGGRSHQFVIKIDNPNTAYGVQINTQASQNVVPEAKVQITHQKHTFHYLDGETANLKRPLIQLKNLAYGELNSALSMRISPSLHGIGLLAKVANKPQHRFNLTATEPSILSQVANAAHQDMGLTNPLHPQENCTKAQIKCSHASTSGDLDLPKHRLEAITFFVEHLNTVSSIKPIRLFKQVGCAKCHTPSYALEQQTIYPYTDLLRHDLGEGKFRTAPLWNSSKAPNFWHDGRAKNVEEAILWHEGEAKFAKQQFVNLPKHDRNKLIQFVSKL